MRTMHFGILAACWIFFSGLPGLAAQDLGAVGGGAQKELEAAREEFGLEAFKDPKKIGNFLAIIAAAIVLGAVLAYHPFAERRSTIEELDRPKIIITYTLVGALVAIVVAPIPAMAFAIFGIGGLMRFRTELGAAKDTGRAILATLLGLSCGLQFWMVAVLGTAVAWVLILVLEYRKSMRMVVRSVKSESVAQAALAYGKVLQGLGSRFSTPLKNPAKGQVAFVLRARRSLDREAIEAECNSKVPEALRGTIDWPEE